ncbi:hypothetical protein KM043_009561 [Ampulex compressa]|nr:hypothetical protein KM043_009561 [Ampulex compressa]
MLSSRVLNLLKLSSHHIRMQNVRNVEPVRFSNSFAYRTLKPASRGWNVTSEVLCGIYWWWILWHLWHDLGHLIGEFPYPDPSKWTSEELGIPADNSD